MNLTSDLKNFLNNVSNALKPCLTNGQPQFATIGLRIDLRTTQ